MLKSDSAPIYTSVCKKAADYLTRAQGRINGFEQVGFAEGFEEALDGALLKQTLADGGVRVGGDEDDGDFLPAKGQFALEIGSGHAGHGDVEDEAFGETDGIGGEESQTDLLQQTPERRALRGMGTAAAFQRRTAVGVSIAPLIIARSNTNST